ncbi:hypothetical protein I307_05496 [Cryptococcus deuterogattii 99/473]|uniref:Uncharacterized protein n=1 Tax=Cryptococcus deuterogattii Ram5 TaxID=1296110 RepID=A0A0D0TVB2_9TREE|nr:hypothetical protein I309_05208 [Cryptococcus deuterogattii LA55]KIR31140.1 hypothetical protein I352_06570 [Cryptococcus deuterogattii MMRL2647]KIR39863.1 hypothetical protein I313_04337 [Cryptococcus deuterogattii Ram5]KIR69679.1 hypothetical protein I310_06531 [Cryptococcus deuterogattii CA1014]KIR90833.1 hypothetical protein I304_05485 [Cryptococcus deuterogattii CBS 10090]KIR97426.1 hypothetical protein L804_05110 [Cryptococcus deuterogattii 2001/935-1]KIY55212.1 hypothetical protein 
MGYQALSSPSNSICARGCIHRSIRNFSYKHVEQASYDRFKSNAGIGKQGFDWVLAGN